MTKEISTDARALLKAAADQYNPAYDAMTARAEAAEAERDALRADRDRYRGLFDIEKASADKDHAEMHKAIAEAAALTAQNQTWQRNSREAFDAMVAMRNSINEHLPMPSLESDLLQGPENSVFCAAVAEAVVSEVSRLRAKVARLEGALQQINVGYGWAARIARAALTETPADGVSNG